ncbi:uncharacterized protein [Drosophila takahashii]|uniref:uncharacterized protein n=1 Tax=Drosophila takahashii TaxID=29030 RepID=UPI003898DA1D
MEDGQNVSSHLNSFSEVLDQLSSVGIEMSDELRAIILLSSLPKEYENFVVAIETRDFLPEFEVLRMKVKEEGERRSHSQENDTHAQAFVATKSFNKKKSVICYKCYKGTSKPNCSLLGALDSDSLGRSKWCLDSGATSHMCCDDKMFTSMKEHSELIGLAGDGFLKAEGKGVVKLKTDRYTIVLSDVLYVPMMKANFMSVSQTVSKGNLVHFNEKHAKIIQSGECNGTPELQVEDEIDSKDLISNGEGKPCSSGYDRSDGKSKDAEQHGHSSDEFISSEDGDSAEDGDLEDDRAEVEDIGARDVGRVGPGRPKLIRTGKPGRPRKQYNVLGAAVNGKIFLPVSYQEAISCPDSELWLEAMEKEYKALMTNQTWQIVDLPTNARAIGYGPHLSLILVYVDDLIIACQDKEDLINIKSKISKSFDCVDQGQLHMFLGMKVQREGELGDITLSQSQYIENLLHRHGIRECKPATTPLDAGFQVSCDKDGCKKVNEQEYQKAIGEIMWLALCTRPAILHSISKLAQRNKDPHIEHWTGVKHVLRYLASTKDLKLHYKNSKEALSGYVDADWGGDKTDRKSRTGYVFYLAGKPISWKSEKQRSVALSSTEAEYMALSFACKEAISLRRLILEIGCGDSKTSTTMHTDNLSAQQLAKNPVHHSRSKHIDIRYHFVRNIVREGQIILQYLPTNQMIN